MNTESKVFIYSDYPSASLSIDFLIDKLRQLGLSIENRGNFIEFLSLSEERLYKLANKLSTIHIDEISTALDTPSPPNSSEIEHEMAKLSGRENPRGKFYDGYWLQRILYRLLSGKISHEFDDQYIHLVFTSRLFGTFEDRRYHARVVLTGTPALISTSGLVEAPAKPKEYYYVKGRLIQSGLGTEELDKMYKSRFVEYDDPKISSIIPSYALQAIFYQITGNAFCDNSDCCLSNSHWQEEVLKVQYEGELCDKCRNLIAK